MLNFKTEEIDRLCEAILLLRNKEECLAFLEDVCTIKEMQDLARRFATARLLDEGESYQKIAEKVEVSTATISRVSRCLYYGSGGYRTLIDRMKDTEGKQ